MICTQKLDRKVKLWEVHFIIGDFLYLQKKLFTTFWMPRQQSHAVRFHPSQTDFTLRSKISFAVRQISLRVRYTTLCIIVNVLVHTPLLPLKCPWPWGVGGRGSGAVGVFHKVLTLKTAIYLLSVIQTLLQIIADEQNPFGGLPRRDKDCRFSQWHFYIKGFI